RVLRPAYRINNRSDLLGVAVLANGSEEIGSLEELILRHSRDALDHLRRISGVLLPKQLKDAVWVLQSQVVGHIFGQMRRRRFAVFAERGFGWRMSSAAVFAA